MNSDGSWHRQIPERRRKDRAGRRRSTGLGSGRSVALSDGRTPGKTPLSEEFVPVDPTIVDDVSKIGATLDKSV
jgi:hypothetical protein